MRRPRGWQPGGSRRGSCTGTGPSPPSPGGPATTAKTRWVARGGGRGWLRESPARGERPLVHDPLGRSGVAAAPDPQHALPPALVEPVDDRRLAPLHLGGSSPKRDTDVTRLVR